jgi:ribonuclease R
MPDHRRRRPKSTGTGHGADPVEKQLLARLGSPRYQPEEAEQLAAALGIPRPRLAAFRDLLRELERRGAVGRVRKTRYVLPSDADLFVGRLTLNPRGQGRVTEEATGTEVFIPASETGVGLHGDRVVVRLHREPAPRPGRARARPAAPPAASDRQQGSVIRILERAAQNITGTLQQSRQVWHVAPDDPRFPHNVLVRPQAAPGAGRKPLAGDKVVVRLWPWESRHLNPEGEIIEILGPAGAPGVDTRSILRRFDISEEFPADVLAEAERIPDTVRASDIEGREDFRGYDVVTIDPDDARDFDDAIHVERIGTGGWRLQVHIADVSHYVRPGTALDREAMARGNSVYLPDRVVPMLPERLSNGLCSLNPMVDRLVRTAVIEFDRSGRRRNARFARGVIRSARRFTYREAFNLLQHPPHEPLSEALHRAWELAALLRKRRFDHGSLDLDLPEIKVRVDPETGRVLRLERVEHDISHQLVEECMLAANEAVAHALRSRQHPALYRVHEPPAPAKLLDFRAFLAAHGHRAGDLTQRQELIKVLERVRDTPEAPAIRFALLRSLMRARYDPAALGHYGLAKTDYAHFTSPIRRYADLVVHRALAPLSSGPPDPVRERPKSTDLTQLGAHLSARERNAADAENAAVEQKKLEYLASVAAEDPGTGFPGLITEVRNFGFFVSVPEFALRGLVHVSALADDFYGFDAVRAELRGRASGRTFRAGNPIQVAPQRVDFLKREIDFRVVGKTAPVARRR